MGTLGGRSQRGLDALTPEEKADYHRDCATYGRCNRGVVRLKDELEASKSRLARRVYARFGDSLPDGHDTIETEMQDDIDHLIRELHAAIRVASDARSALGETFRRLRVEPPA